MMQLARREMLLLHCVLFCVCVCVYARCVCVWGEAALYNFSLAFTLMQTQVC